MAPLTLLRIPPQEAPWQTEESEWSKAARG